MNALKLLAMLVAILAAPALAQDNPVDPRVRIVDYRSDQVIRIDCAPGYQLTIDLAADERVTSVAVGDTGAWQVVVNRAGNQLVVKATQGGIATNMTVTTSERSYQFDLVPGYSPSLYRLRFNYPLPPPTSASQPNGQMYRYRLSGARSLWPSRIGDDGQRTFIEWPEAAGLPAVYAIDSQGRETLVNGMMRDDRLVIDAVSRQLVFRIDDHVARAKRQARPEDPQ